MKSKSKEIETYIAQLPTDRQEIIEQLIQVVHSNLPTGFELTFNYGMIGFVVPHTLYPEGYHCDPKQPLPFIHIASQKNFISFYHMGIYAIPSLMEWFVDTYSKTTASKLDMGKSCIRFKKLNQIPFDLLGTLCQKIDPVSWIECYEQNLKKNTISKNSK